MKITISFTDDSGSGGKYHLTEQQFQDFMNMKMSPEMKQIKDELYDMYMLVRYTETKDIDRR